jgi:hypothetical protein
MRPRSSAAGQCLPKTVFIFDRLAAADDSASILALSLHQDFHGVLSYLRQGWSLGGSGLVKGGLSEGWGLPSICLDNGKTGGNGPSEGGTLGTCQRERLSQARPRSSPASGRDAAFQLGQLQPDLVRIWTWAWAALAPGCEETNQFLQEKWHTLAPFVSVEPPLSWFIPQS